MKRDDALKLYVDTIMERGNPRYFIYIALDRIDNEELIELMEEMEIEVDEIEDEDE